VQAAHELFRHAERILRPGLPAAIRLEEYRSVSGLFAVHLGRVPHQQARLCPRFADRFSPPYRDDNKEGHYVYAVGENISSRCKSPGTSPLLLSCDNGCIYLTPAAV
jgi:hypothetical protein